MSGEFAKRGVKMAALSCDEVDSHNGWINDILAYNGLTEFSYPIIADPKREIAEKYGMLDPVAKDNSGIPLTCRFVSFIQTLGYKCKSQNEDIYNTKNIIEI